VQEGKGEFPVDWVITGREHVVSEEPTLKIEFQHEINTHIIPAFTGGEYDIGEFLEIEGSDDRLEKGEMLNLSNGKVEKYEEVWRSIDPVASTDTEYVELKGEQQPEPKVTVLKVVAGQGYLGTVVRLGNFLQGAILDQANNKVSVVRYYKQGKLFAYGGEASKIPTDGEGEVLELDGLKWEIIEKN
jgi:hypothetical protein